MKILKVIHGYPPDYNAGSEVYSQSVCNELSIRHKVTVFTREENPYLPEFSIRYNKENEHLSFYYINMALGKDGFRHEELDKKFEKIILKEKPEVAHIGHLNHLSTGIIDILNKHRIPVVYTLHDFWLMCPRGQFLQRNYDGIKMHQLCYKQENQKCAEICYKMYHSGYKESPERSMEYEIRHRIPEGKDALNDLLFWTNWVDTRMDETRSIVQKTGIFIAPSKYLMNRFINDFQMPRKKIRYLDYGFPLQYLTTVGKKKDKELFTIGYIGTHIPSKGLNILIDAFKKISKPAYLKIWGHKEIQSTRALMKMAEGSINTIYFNGEYINKNLANEVFSEVDCIVVPSIWAENSPLVIHEAQACRIPVITADFGGMSEYVHHKINGLLFRHRDSNSLAEQILWAIEHPLEMKTYGRKGYLNDIEGKVPDIETHCIELVGIYYKAIENYGK